MQLHATAERDSEREFAFSDRDFHFISDWAYQRIGIVLAEQKRDMVYSRLSRRLRALGLGSFADYCRLIQGPEGETEAGNLVNALTTNLTRFFREQHHFDHLQRELTLMCAVSRRIRIWSAGCSCGMETYSIAMVLKSVLDSCGARDARILATDIDTSMLDTAMSGVYPGAELDHIPTRYRAMVATDGMQGSISMAQELKDLISFKRLNLLEHWPMQGKFDAVFCRNVVIYFDKPTQKTLFNRFAEIIKPSGWLYIGHSENLQNVCDRFDLEGRTVYRRAR